MPIYIVKNKSTLKSLLSYVVAAGFIFNCNSMWKNATNTSKYGLLVFVAMIGALLILVLLKCHEKGDRLPKRSIFISLFFLIYGAIYCLAVGQIRNVVPLICTMICSTLLIDLYDEEGLPRVLTCYKNIMIIIAISSLFFWFFGSMLHVISANGYVTSAWSNFETIPSYYGVYFEAHSNAITFLGKVTQNTSVFTEPPMAAVNFCFALLFTYFEKPSLRLKRQRMILFLSILSTVSVLGLIFLVSLYFVRLSDNRSANYNYDAEIKCLFFILFAIVIIYAVNFVIRDKLGSASGVVRLDDYQAGYKAWRGKPIFGYGIGNDKPIQQYMSAWRSSNLGYSSPIMAILAETGIYGAILYIYALVKGVYRAIKLRKSNVNLLMIFICIVLFSCVIEYSYIFLFLLIWVSRSENLKKFPGE